MMLLSVSDSLQVVNSTTDWMQGWGAIVQAIGAIGAIVVIIWGFTQFNKDSRDKQKQIDGLTTLAKESKEQTKHLLSQVDEMIKGNKLQTEYVRLFLRIVEISDKKRKQEIKPCFDSLSMRQRENGFQIELRFIGQSATLLKTESIEDENLIPSFIDKYIDNKVSKGNLIHIQIFDNTKNLTSDLLNKYLQIKIVFKDIDGNEYFQLIEGTYSGRMNLHEPIEIPVLI
jgi:hypothetical protein